MPYYTIGYEGVKLEGFILCLEQHGIQVLADVREKPYSRKPGFSQRALRDAVSSHGIRYQHFQRLGCPLDIRSAYQEDGDWGRYRMAFNRYLRRFIVLHSSIAQLDRPHRKLMLGLYARFRRKPERKIGYAAEKNQQRNTQYNRSNSVKIVQYTVKKSRETKHFR